MRAAKRSSLMLNHWRYSLPNSREPKPIANALTFAAMKPTKKPSARNSSMVGKAMKKPIACEIHSGSIERWPFQNAMSVIPPSTELRAMTVPKRPPS